MNNLREKLEGFLYNLDLQIDDLERLDAGERIQVFFDTAHLVSAVIGLHDFYNQAGTFKRSRFESPTALVTSLAAGNWLGEIRLLPPHQAEFLRKWKLDFGVGPTKRPEILAKQFLKDVGYTDNNWTMKRSLASLSDEQIRALILNNAASAPAFFKAVQSIFPWHRRMAKMLDDEVLTFHSTTEDYEGVMNSGWPEKLAEVFNRKRRDMSINNVTDALAIALLVEKIRAFKDKETKILPFLFPSDWLLESFENTKLEQELTYGHTREGRAITAVKDWTYFVFKASFNVTNGRHTRRMTKEMEAQLRTLRKEVATMLAVNDEISIDLVAQRKAFGKPLSQLIDEIDQLSFIENVWLKAKAPTDLRSAVRELIEAREDFRRSKRVQNQATRILGEKLRVLSSNVGEIEWLIQLWADLEKQGKRLHQETFSEDLQSRDFFRDRGLLRYSFPEKPRSKIEHILRELVQGAAFGEARRLVINACLKGIKDPAGERDDLVTGAAVLSALGMNEQLIGLLERVDRSTQLPHYSLKIAYAEQIFLQRENRQRGEGLLDELKQEYEGSSRSPKKADLAIGLAYLMFRLWALKGGKVRWRPLDYTETAEEPQPIVQKFVDDAIYYANQAFIGSGKSRDLKKKVYALNQYLYYLVEGGDNSRLTTMIETAQVLTGFAGQSQVWQYRFDDTLARYFHRMATTKTNAEDWAQAMESAHDHIERACKRAYGDPVPLGCLSKIDTAIQAGFGAILKPKRPPRVIRISKSTKRRG